MKVNVILLQKEYLETIEGQNALVDRINGDSGEELYFEEGMLGSTDLALEGFYHGLFQSASAEALFFGEREFEYRYTPWECELNKEDPGDEEIEANIRACYGDVDDEELECIKESTAFHDMVQLKWVTAERAGEIAAELSVDKLTAVMEELENKLKEQGISVDEWHGQADMDFLERLLACMRDAAGAGTGVLFAHKLYD